MYREVRNSVRGFVVLDSKERKEVPLMDPQGHSFTPTIYSVFALYDLILKNESGEGGSFSMYCGTSKVSDWHIAGDKSLTLQFRKPLSFYDKVYAITNCPPAKLTVVGCKTEI